MEVGFDHRLADPEPLRALARAGAGFEDVAKPATVGMAKVVNGFLAEAVGETGHGGW